MERKERLKIINAIIIFINFICCVLMLLGVFIVMIVEFVIVIPLWLFGKNSWNYYWDTDFWEFVNNNYMQHPLDFPIKKRG